ncbi:MULTISPECIES: helix-turn-helix domain-containing protein [Sphingobacterium]|uniref:helix-turn-helix domain-containing protein n=1 Tax=Sphingobacterium TaxID=28453 RepID=UPI00122FE7DE|nr:MULTISPECIES: helix-turn-helix transcriptional regulator [Sphingobacterium]
MVSKVQIEAYQRSFIEFLKKKFCSPYKISGNEVSRNDYANKSGISRGTLTRINDGSPYDIPLSTIYKLCTFENISVPELFQEFDKSLNE